MEISFGKFLTPGIIFSDTATLAAICTRRVLQTQGGGAPIPLSEPNCLHSCTNV